MNSSSRIWYGAAWLQVVVIILMVPYGRAVEGAVRERFGGISQTDPAALAAVLLSGMALLLFLNWKSFRSLSWMYWLALACVSSAIVYAVKLPVEAFHIVIYATLAMSLYWPMPRISDVKCLIIINFVSIMDESLQGLHPQRFFDFRDLALNFLGCLAGLLVILPFIYAARRHEALTFLQALFINGRKYTV